MRPFALITFPLILAALACPALGLANPYGVLTARAVAKPEQIEPGEKTQLTVQVYDGFKKPISTANIKISIKTGYFEASNQNAVHGFTDKDGLFVAVWHSNLQTPNGINAFEITANKNGYIGKYPVTTTARVKVGEEEKTGVSELRR